MAKAEFYEISIRDKKENIIIDTISLNEVIIGHLSKNSDIDNFCEEKHCSVLLNTFRQINDTKVVYNFTKFTSERVLSSLISEPSKSIDIFDEYDKEQLAKTIYNDEEYQKILEITSITPENELASKLKKCDIDKYKIYKIILDNSLLSGELLESFKNKVMKRLKNENIYFKVIESFEKSNKKILLYQSFTDGLDVKYLEKYLNTHLLVNEDFKIIFHKLYDADFMELLANGELKKFMFSYSIENKNNLLDKDLFNPFYSVSSLFGNNITKIEIKPDESDEVLDNEKLLDFFEKASENGLLDSCEISTKKSGNKKISFKDKKLNIEYTENISIKSLDEAVQFLSNALKERENILKNKLGLING